MFGLRYNRLNGRIDFKAPINMEVENTRDWIDPVVGVILRKSPSRGGRRACGVAVDGTRHFLVAVRDSVVRFPADCRSRGVGPNRHTLRPGKRPRRIGQGGDRLHPVLWRS